MLRETPSHGRVGSQEVKVFANGALTNHVDLKSPCLVGIQFLVYKQEKSDLDMQVEKASSLYQVPLCCVLSLSSFLISFFISGDSSSCLRL